MSTTIDIAIVLELHGKWLRSEEGGKRAIPYRANLQDANLQDANLRNANLWGANLRYANLWYANLRYADLRYANLRYANLRGEFRFCERRWRFDFAWPSHWVAVEIDGGIFVGGRHVDPMGGHGDRDKLNRESVLGWKVLRYDAKHLRDDPPGVFHQVMEALGAFCVDDSHD